MTKDIQLIEGKLESEKYLEEIIDAFESTAFPLFFQKTTEGGPTQYAHSLVTRVPGEQRELGQKEEGKEGNPNSQFWEIAKHIFDRFCDENNIQYTKIFRASINVTHYFPDDYSGIHFDHYFPHKNFVFFLNDFTNGSTLIFDDEDNIIKELKAERLKGVTFDCSPHAQQSCGIGERRMVLVVTYI
jgi:hypothetical protein